MQRILVVLVVLMMVMAGAALAAPIPTVKGSGPFFDQEGGQWAIQPYAGRKSSFPTKRSQFVTSDGTPPPKEVQEYLLAQKPEKWTEYKFIKFPPQIEETTLTTTSLTKGEAR